MNGEDGQPMCMVGCNNEIGAKQKADNVSGLLGETSLQDYLYTIGKVFPEGFILRIGIDDFKDINENLGIEYGDMIIHETANCIARCIAPGQQLYRIVADEFGAVPGEEGIFSGGDCVSGPSTVIRAIAAGKAAAANIDEYLGFHHEMSTDVEIPQPNLNDKLQSGRIHLTDREACERKKDFEGVEYSMSLEEARQESARCLRCDKFGCGVFRGGRESIW